MRITSKGQVTIPQAIREQAGLLPHTEVEFQYVRGKVYLRPVSELATSDAPALRRLKGSLKHLKMTTDELMALTRGED